MSFITTTWGQSIAAKLTYAIWIPTAFSRDETEDFYRDIAKDVEKRLDSSGYSKYDNRPLPIGENKKVIGLMKDGLGGKIVTEFVALRAKMYAYRKMN